MAKQAKKLIEGTDAAMATAETSGQNCDKAIATVKTGAVSYLQAKAQMDVIIHNAAMACITHAALYGDVRKMGNLFDTMSGEKLIGHRAELYSWVRANSPIYYSAKDKETKLAKEGTANYVPFNLEQAAEVPFHRTELVAKAREAAEASLIRNLKPADFNSLRKRALGLSNWMKSNDTENDKGQVRGVVENDRPRMERLIAAIEKTVADFETAEKAALGGTIPKSEVPNTAIAAALVAASQEQGNVPAVN